MIFLCWHNDIVGATDGWPFLVLASELFVELEIILSVLKIFIRFLNCLIRLLNRHFFAANDL